MAAVSSRENGRTSKTRWYAVVTLALVDYSAVVIARQDAWALWGSCGSWKISIGSAIRERSGLGRPLLTHSRRNSDGLTDGAFS